MKSFWNGSFVKHRLYTGDLANHLEVKEYDVEKDESGEWVAHIVIGYIGSNDSYREYDIDIEGPDVTEGELIDAFINQYILNKE